MGTKDQALVIHRLMVKRWAAYAAHFFLGELSSLLADTVRSGFRPVLTALSIFAIMQNAEPLTAGRENLQLSH